MSNGAEAVYASAREANSIKGNFFVKNMPIQAAAFLPEALFEA